MAGNDGSVSESEKCPPSLICKEGPVLSMMSKRLRALKKKYNKILQIEESRVQGKVINKEQEEVLKTKIAVAALIDEYEKLRQPLLVAVKEELVEREKELMAAALRRDEGGEDESMAGEEKDAEVVDASQPKPTGEVRKESEVQGSAVSSSENVGLNADKLEKAPGAVSSVVELEHAHDASSGFKQQYASSGAADGNIADLLTLLYFAQLFDVRSHGEASSSVLWTKAHERSSCLSYDCVTEDETSPLLETDLDDLSLFGSLLTSRPPNATLSHRDALQHCLEHAKLWLQNSDALIREGLDLTYVRLRERLNRILSSEYFTMIPELQTVTQQMATAEYASQLLIHKPDGAPGSDDATVYFSPQEPTSQQPPYQFGEHYPTQPLAANASSETSGADFGSNPSEMGNEDKTTKVDSCALPVDERQPLPNGVQQEHDGTRSADSSLQEGSQEQEGQQQQPSHVPNVTVGPRGHQGPKGGGRGPNVPGTGGRGRGYANGRGGRTGGGRGGYGNGWSGQYYDQGQGGYYPRNYNGRGGGRGMRGGSSSYNGYTNGQAARATNNIPA
eukprot:c18232_g1_i1 orf=318-2000(+)